MSWNRHEFFDLKRFVVSSSDDDDNNISTKEHGKIWNKLPASQITCAITRDSYRSRTRLTQRVHHTHSQQQQQQQQQSDGTLFFGDVKGYVTILNPSNLSRTVRFKPHRALVSHMRSIVLSASKDFLITLGDGIDHRSEATKASAVAAAALGSHTSKYSYLDDEEDDNTLSSKEEQSEPISFVYVWDLSKLNTLSSEDDDDDDKESSKNVLSTPSRRFRVFGRGEKEVPITFMNVSKDGHYLALGLLTGQVKLFYGKNVLEDNSWGLSIGMSNDAPAFVNLSHDATSPVSHLSFTTSTLFVVHASSSSSISSDDEVGVVTYRIPPSSDHTTAPSPKDSTVLEQRGSNCATLGFALGSKTQNHLAVGMDEAVYFFSKDDRGQCYALGSRKQELSWYRRYLLVLYCDNDEEEDEDTRNVLAAYDLGNRLVSAHVQLPNNERIRFVLPQPDRRRIMLWTFSNHLWILQERSLQSKLELLYKDHLYPLALSVIRSFASSYLEEKEDENILKQRKQEIESMTKQATKMYADHLYSKSQYQEAIEQYILTIGHLEPSYVIRKFLDTQRTSQLSTYVEELHHRQLAGPSHTALLLNCYTKMRDQDALNRFIRMEGRWAHAENADRSTVKVEFNVDAAIRTLRAAGFYENALYLAKRHERHAQYCEIQVEDRDDVKAAMTYLETLSKHPEITSIIMKRHCLRMIPVMPQRVTKFLQQLCSSDSTTCLPEDFFHCFLGHPKELKQLLQHYLLKQNNTVKRSEPWNTLVELLLQERDAHLIAKRKNGVVMCEEQLESILNLSRKRVFYDRDYILCLFQLHGFHRGLVRLYMDMRKYCAALKCYAELNQTESMFELCERHGEKDPDLWIHLLTCLNDEKVLMRALERIDEQNLLPPMLVLRILSSKSSITLSAVKSYLKAHLTREMRSIRENEKEIRGLRASAKAMREEYDALRTTARVFSSRKCSKTQLPLKLPSVHFMDGNSYNITSLSIDTMESPRLSREIRGLERIRSQLRKRASHHEQFFEELEHSPDGFAKISEHLGRGLFERAE